jgi:putative transposase
MKPDTETTNAFLYCLAFAAGETQVQVVFFLAMSNHYHAGVIDKAGRLPEFLACFHRLFAKHQNVLRGRWENFWASEQTSVVELVDDQDGLDKMVYALTNPVKDHLVARAAEWPGASSLTAQLHGHSIKVSRPRLFFRPDGRMPDEAILELAPLPCSEPTPQSAMLALLIERIEIAERDAAAERERTRTEVMGREAISKQRWFDRPASLEPRRNLSPKVACRNLWRRIEALQRNKTFVAAHRAARELAAQGIAVLFPAGTYWRRKFGGCQCEELPPLSATA